MGGVHFKPGDIMKKKVQTFKCSTNKEAMNEISKFFEQMKFHKIQFAEHRIIKTEAKTNPIDAQVLWFDWEDLKILCETKLSEIEADK